MQIIREDFGDQSNAAAAAHLDTGSHAARQMQRQIDGLMDLSRLNRTEMQLPALNAGQLVRDVCAALAPALAGRGSTRNTRTSLHSAREFEGLGMGLAPTRKVVERHGGVWVTGAPDSGCSVSFTLPLANPAH